MSLRDRLKVLMRGLRAVSGDDAYERYVAHFHKAHGHDAREQDCAAPQAAPQMTRSEFYLAECRRRFEGGPKRCC